MVNKSIEEYVKARVAKMKVLAGTKLGDSVVLSVSTASEGLWPYARLILGEIQQMPNTAIIRRQLGNIPYGLQHLYTQVLLALESGIDDWQLQILQQIFLWMDIEDFMPNWMSTEFLEDRTVAVILQFASSGEPVEEPIPLIRTLCSPVIETY